MLFTDLGRSVLGKLCPRSEYSRPRAQFLPIRTSQPVNNKYLFRLIYHKLAKVQKNITKKRVYMSWMQYSLFMTVGCVTFFWHFFHSLFFFHCIQLIIVLVHFVVFLYTTTVPYLKVTKAILSECPKGGVNGQKCVIWPKYNNPKEFNSSNLTDMDTIQFPLFTHNLAALKISQFVLIHKIIFNKVKSKWRGIQSPQRRNKFPLKQQHRGYSQRSI